MIEIRGPHQPAIVTFFDGQTYAVSGINWIKVPKNTKLSDLKYIQSSKVKSDDISVKYHGKTGIYRVQRIAGQWSCNCTGFHYRRTCSHIDNVKIQKGITK